MQQLTIIIKDISKGKGEAFAAQIRELNNSIAMGDSLKELFEGIRLTIDTAKKEEIGIFSKTKKTEGNCKKMGSKKVMAN